MGRGKGDYEALLCSFCPAAITVTWLKTGDGHAICSLCGVGAFVRHGGGYQISSLKEVPVVLAGGTVDNPNQTVADFALSGIYGHLGISLNFD